MSSADAVVIGAGPNGLVAANLLADAGWDVLLLEAQPEVGGAVRSARDVHPDFVHDTFSAFHPLAVASPAIRALGLDRFGLEWTQAPAVVGTPFPDGRWAVLHRDRLDTAACLDTFAAGDGDAWLRLCARWDEIGEPLLAALLSPFPPVAAGLRTAGRLADGGGLGAARDLLAPAQSLIRRWFQGEAAEALLVGNAAHADIPLHRPGSGLFGLLLSMLGQQVGFPAPRGGAGSLSTALVRRFTSYGGSVRTGTRIEEVLVSGGRAVGVRTTDGEVVMARRAVLADVPAPTLYGRLLPWARLPARVRLGMRRFRWDPGTVKVDWALSGPVPWSAAPARPPGTVHVGATVPEVQATYAQIAAHAVPDRPFLLLGQMAASDPSRAPAGGEAMWAYSHVPQLARFDAGDAGIAGVWDAADCERMADRMQARIQELAPGFGARVLARRVLGPRELEARDENLVGGAINGGTARLRQQLFLRPVPGLARPRTPVRGLYLASASAHPGGGVHGACGANAARAALAHGR